jgi:hypothetical protein
MSEENKSNPFTDAIIIFAVIIGFLMIYSQYQKNEFIKQQEQRKLEQESIQRASLNSCLDDAEFNYNINWATSCKKHLESTKIDYIYQCSLVYDQNYCKKQVNNIKHSVDCALPSSTSNNIEQARKDEKDRCFKKFPIK